MRPSRLLLIAVAGEGLLAIVALVWIRAKQLQINVGHPSRDVAAGLVLAVALAALYLYLIRSAPDVAPVRELRRLSRDVFAPIFRDVTASEIAIISLAAGVGEELLFRGAIQTVLGIVPASVLFGVVHTAGRGTLWFGGWAAMTGFTLGVLADATGGLLGPIVAHAVYDGLAIAYIRQSGVGGER